MYRQQINQDLANRLIECQYEVTDKFSNYLCHRKPDHEKGIHFLIPQSTTKSDSHAISKLKKVECFDKNVRIYLCNYLIVVAKSFI